LRAIAKSWCLVLLMVLPTRALAEQLTLEGAVKLALANNERSKKAPLRVRVAEGQLERARDGYLPTLTASGTSTYRPDARAGNNPTTNGSLTLSQPLLSPSFFPQYSQQKHNLESEKWGSVQDQRQLAFEVAKAFMQALAADNVLTSAQRKLDAAKLNLETSQARAGAGLASTNDVTKAELQLATTQGQLANAQGNVKRTYLALSFLLTQKVEGPLVPPDNTTRAAQEFEQARQNQVKRALDRRAQVVAAAHERRPDLRAIQERNAGLEDSAKEPLYRLIPSVNASGQLRIIPDPLPSEKALDEQVAVSLNWQVFDSGFRYADRKQRLAQLESARLDEKLLKRSVQNDIELSLVALRAARENYRTAQAAAIASQKNAEETNVLYQQGLARAIEVSDANDKQFEAEVTRESAKLSMEQAYLDLRSALGFGPLDQDKVTK
jgi:outer membrane protein TolC